MTQPIPTPTSHGAWRVIDGKLVNEDEQPPALAGASKAMGYETTPPAADTKPNSTHRKTSAKD